LTPSNFACIIINMKLRRTYTMHARAESTAATRQSILDATAALLKARFRSDIHLDAVADAAQVSVQTILRNFGSRAALMESAQHVLEQYINDQRNRAVPGDIPGAISDLFDHYEEFGDLVIRQLADEADPSVQPLLAIGRTRHRQWVDEHFGPRLVRHESAMRQRLLDALVCICDAYTWKLLRRDIGRSRPDAEMTMVWMVKAMLGEA
jgi:AcrR family transcriptional regulator